MLPAIFAKTRKMQNVARCCELAACTYLRCTPALRPCITKGVPYVLFAQMMDFAHSTLLQSSAHTVGGQPSWEEHWHKNNRRAGVQVPPFVATRRNPCRIHTIAMETGVAHLRGAAMVFSLFHSSQLDRALQHKHHSASSHYVSWMLCNDSNTLTLARWR